MRELWVAIAHTSGAKIYAMVLGVFTLSLTARLLGPEGRGYVAAITTWVGMFSSLSTLSLGQVALHRMASDRDRRRFGALLGSLLFFTIALTGLGWLVALGIYAAKPDGAFKGLPLIPLLLGFLALPFLIWEQYGSSLLMGLDKVRIYNRFQVIGRTVAVVFVFVLVGGLGLSVAGVVGANLVGQVIVALGGIGFLFSMAGTNGQSRRPERAETKALLSGGAKLHFNAVGVSLLTSTNILILSHYHGAEQTGQFQLANQLLGVMMIIPQAGSMVIYGKVAKLGPNGAWLVNRRLLTEITLGMVGLGIIAALCAPWGIVLLAGEPFRPVVSLFRWMLPGLIGMTFSTVMAPQWIGRGFFWQAASLTALVGTVNLAANFLLIPKHGMWGAIYAFLATSALAIVANGAMALWCDRQVGNQAAGEVPA